MSEKPEPTAAQKWEDSLPHVRLELHPQAVLSKVFVNDQEWATSIRRLVVDVEDGLTVVTLAFYARLDAEGPLNLQPWPLIVENEPRGSRGE